MKTDKELFHEVVKMPNVIGQRVCECDAMRCQRESNLGRPRRNN